MTETNDEMICIWPDNTYCSVDEVEEYLEWMSDDYILVGVSEEELAYINYDDYV